MSCYKVFFFLLFEILVSLPVGLFLYWLLALQTENFQGDNMRVYLHAMVMLFAFTFSLAQGIAVIRVCPGSRRCVRITHAIFNSLSLLFGVAGLILIVSYKFEYSRDHLVSVHSWCGAGLLLLVLCQFVGGSIILQSCCTGASEKSRKRYAYKHAAFGIGILLLAGVTIVTGVLSLKDYLEYGSILDRGLDFENTLLNLVVVSAILVFVLITYIVVSARGSAAAYTGRYESSRVTESKVEKDGKSSLKSKQVSNDTAYSDFSSAGPRRSQSQQRSRSGDDPNSQQGPRRSSSNRQSQRSTHNGPPPAPSSGPQQARSPENRPRSRSSDHRPRPDGAVPRSPDSYKPRSPDNYHHTGGQHFFPSDNGGPRSPKDPMTGPRSPKDAMTGPRSPHHHQGTRSPPPPSDHSYQMAYHDPHAAAPPPLFEGGLRQSQRGSRGPPPPISTNPPTSQPVGVVSPFPSQYEGQPEDVEPPVKPQRPQPPANYQPPVSYQQQNPNNYQQNPNNYQQNPQNNQQYPQNYQQQQQQPNNYNPDPRQPFQQAHQPYPDPNQPTNFNPRPPNRHQQARIYRYEARRAKVEQANMSLQRPTTPPASSYTESLGPNRTCLSPVEIYQDEGESESYSDCSEDVDGQVPRRGRTSYRNAVKEVPPPVPPPPQEYAGGGPRDDYWL